MSGGPADLDVIVVGAGAAGLSAGRWLAELGLAVRVLEARQRIGGRAWTDTVTFPWPFDRGCEWLHSAERNPLTREADAAGFSVVRETAAWSVHRNRVDMTEPEHRQWIEYADHWEREVNRLGGEGLDVAIADVVPKGHRWSPVLDAAVTYGHGTEPCNVSTLDFARYDDSGTNWPILEGYGALIARLGRDVPVSLGAVVDHIDWSGATIRVSGGFGALSARAVIVTVPVSLLDGGAIRFTPRLPDDKLEALATIRLGKADKVGFEVIGDPFGTPADTFQFGRTDSARTASIHIRPRGRPMAQGYVAGSLADDLETAGPAAMRAFVLDELAGLFGGAVRAAIGRSTTTAWGRDPYALGAYSNALPGHAHRREDLARPLDERLYFAGEACSIDAFGTAHGAWLTGRAAATAAAARGRPAIRT
jgi:monoamine oxidase